MMAQLEHNPIAELRTPTSVPAFERHFAPDELAGLWGLSGDTIRRLFEKEPGVFVVEHAKARGARRYRTMRIPESVALRVHRRSTNPVAVLNR